MEHTYSLTYVLGIQRSGTTWLGRTLAAGTRSRYVHEPFNFKSHPECKRFWLRYLPASANEKPFLETIQNAIAPQHWWQHLLRRKVVVKDVHIWPAAPYISHAFGPKLVICVRHPCAVAASWARLNYPARSLNRLLSGSGMVQKYLADFVPHLQSSEDYFFRIGAFWGAAYYTLAQMSGQYSEWTWITHERLCRDAHDQFEHLAARLGLRFTGRGHEFLESHDRQNDKSKKTYSAVRRTSAQPEKWRDELTAAQQQAVWAGAGPFGIFEKRYGDDTSLAQ